MVRNYSRVLLSPASVISFSVRGYHLYVFKRELYMSTACPVGSFCWTIHGVLERDLARKFSQQLRHSYRFRKVAGDIIKETLGGDWNISWITLARSSSIRCQ
jgi:hypothetical protein